MAKYSLRIFLCHASADKLAVRKLYNCLVSDGFDVWLDEENLLPGQNWREEIPKAVRGSEIIIVCLSERSINKEGYVQKEIKLALDIADEKPEGTIFIIPARLDDCRVPDRLQMYQWVDLHTKGGYEKILHALTVRENQTTNLPPDTKAPARADTFSYIKSETSTSGISSASLRKVIHNAYSQPEFEILCYDLGVRPDDLQGSTFERKILDLIAWHERRQKYDKLISKVLEDRPHLASSLFAEK